MAQGMARVDAIREVQITEQTFYRWGKQYGGMGTDRLRELKRLQKEDARLRRGGVGSDAGQAHFIGNYIDNSTS